MHVTSILIGSDMIYMWSETQRYMLSVIWLVIRWLLLVLYICPITNSSVILYRLVVNTHDTICDIYIQDYHVSDVIDDYFRNESRVSEITR